MGVAFVTFLQLVMTWLIFLIKLFLVGTMVLDRKKYLDDNCYWLPFSPFLHSWPYWMWMENHDFTNMHLYIISTLCIDTHVSISIQQKQFQDLSLEKKFLSIKNQWINFIIKHFEIIIPDKLLLTYDLKNDILLPHMTIPIFFMNEISMKSLNMKCLIYSTKWPCILIFKKILIEPILMLLIV